MGRLDVSDIFLSLLGIFKTDDLLRGFGEDGNFLCEKFEPWADRTVGGEGVVFGKIGAAHVDVARRYEATVVDPETVHEAERRKVAALSPGRADETDRLAFPTVSGQF